MNFPFVYLRDSFMARVVAATLFLLTMTTMALSAYFSLRAAERLKSDLIHHNQSLARSLANSSRVAIYTGNKEQLLAAASYLASDPECQMIVYYEENGIPLLHYQGKDYRQGLELLPDQDIPQHIRSHPRSASLLRTAGSSIVIVEPVLTGPRFSFIDMFADTLVPAEAAGQDVLIGYVAMVVDTASVRQQAQGIFVRDTAITIGITLFGWLLILVVIHRAVATPLRSLVGEIRRLQGDESCAVRKEPFLPSDFAEMVAILRTSYNTIYELKTGLEEKVSARTRQLKSSNQELVAQKDAMASTNRQLADTLSQLRAAQAQLVHSEKMAALGMMISGLSHEIKNSINFIATSLPLLEMTLDSALKEGGGCPADKVTVLLGNIREGVDRTIRVVSDLTIFCHEGGAGFVPVDILPGLKASVAIVRREFADRIVINEEHATVLPMIRGLAGQLSQVILNILLNAAQAITDRGTITVKSWEKGGVLHVSIADTGSGIDDMIVGRIFDPFFTTKEVGKGTGLGLSISYSIIKNHGGDILVRSERGHGTIFELVLPVCVGGELGAGRGEDGTAQD